MRTFFLVVTLIITSNFSRAQSFDGIISAIKSGNSSALAQNFQGNVEITIKESEASYSKVQAEQVLRSFFSSNKPTGFAIAHQGTSPEGSKYFIGTLNTSSGNFRTYVYAKSSGGGLSIQEIRFEAQ